MSIDRPGLNTRTMIEIRSIIAGLCFALGLTQVIPVASAEEIYNFASSEKMARTIDEVALSSQEQAIVKLTVLVKKYKNTRQEPVLLAKLADIQQQAAAILFRIAHGQKVLPNDLSSYNKMMHSSIDTLDRLITSYPVYEEIAHAYFMRAKAYEEIANKALATKDYLFLIKHFKNAEDTPAATMSLAEFAIEANNHQAAIEYLGEIEKIPEDPHYPFALYKLAWSYYNLKNVTKALYYAERHVETYNRKIADRNLSNLTDLPDNAKYEASLATSDFALKENTLLDATVFFFEGYEEGLPEYGLGKALAYFRKLDHGFGTTAKTDPGLSTLGKMALRFAKLLRSHAYEVDLLKWKNQVLAEEAKQPESLDIVITVYEYQKNKHFHAGMIESARDMSAIYAVHPEFGSFRVAQKLLLDTAEEWQALIMKNRDADEVHAMSVKLAAMYDSFTHLVPENDQRVPLVHYNLAETLFAIKDFSGATGHYRWIVERIVERIVEHSTLKHNLNQNIIDNDNINDADIKAIAARYEVLAQKGFIAKNVNSSRLQEDVAVASSSKSSLDPLFSEWLTWLDARAKAEMNEIGDKRLEKRARLTENFMFEANRSLYSHGHILLAVKRLKEFAQTHPASDYATPSASLVLDTFIASEAWEETHALAKEFMKIPAWNNAAVAMSGKNSEFARRLFSVAADAFYKIIEVRFNAGKYEDAIKGTEEFIVHYSSSQRLSDCLSIGGHAALIVAQDTATRNRALGYFSRLIELHRDIESATDRRGLGLAYLARATIEDERYELDLAAKDYLNYLKYEKDTGQLDLVRKKILLYTWLTSSPSELSKVLSQNTVCNEALQNGCDSYRALILIDEKRGTQPVEARPVEIRKVEKARFNNKNRALWAIAIITDDGATAGERSSALRVFASGWSEIDSLIKYAIFPILSESIPGAIRGISQALVNDVGSLKPNEKSIASRVKAIQDLESLSAEVIQQLPWARIRAGIMNEVASSYLGFARELGKLPPPTELSDTELVAYEDTIRKLVIPFEEKGQELRAKAFEIASTNSIEESSYLSIAEPFFAENPSQAKLLKLAKGPIGRPDGLDWHLLTRLDSEGKWDELFSSKDLRTDDLSLKVKKLWMKAIREKNWKLVGFFLKEAQDKAYIQAGVMGVVKAISFASAGAQAEALAELDEARKDLNGQASSIALATLLKYSLSNKQ